MLIGAISHTSAPTTLCMLAARPGGGRVAGWAGESHEGNRRGGEINTSAPTLSPKRHLGRTSEPRPHYTLLRAPARNTVPFKKEGGGVLIQRNAMHSRMNEALMKTRNLRNDFERSIVESPMGNGGVHDFIKERRPREFGNMRGSQAIWLSVICFARETLISYGLC